MHGQVEREFRNHRALAEGKVIGGYSFPNKEMVGWYFSLDGKTLDEVTGLSFKEWSEKWKQKYGS
jgi:hypothetical protein